MGAMVVITTTAVPDSLRGALSRWMVEPAPGVFVGTMSTRVREELWARVEESIEDGAATCMHPADNEQGFDLLTAGQRRREVADWDGIQLIRFNPLDSPGPEDPKDLQGG
ncbi:type I-E CRISPR-associated endoribonuclease Cas2 [Spiractinospora alimapuensis]|uniref:type I-E CRISPR-associated endoribonuclease Cas2e n=1 Tax=Spiractinospora alimapuensis TaxID=2820884 RepID=UPI001F23E90A|nr:type I-E CRISPR-associated endoribonuclease Cas2e [Spiractinospora alimapuensis]QVQ51558.1 type I-E CRISPR-associated endoribonuclease Cas2 [Spiractinospora alimapuensis]